MRGRQTINPMSTRVIGLCLSLALTLTNCYYDNEEALYGVEQCSTEPVTYAGTISGILQRNCLSCHSQSANSGGVVLETYAQVKVQATSGKLVGVVSHAPGFSSMPKNAPQLSECNVSAIRQWVEAGALDN
jgi:hypothetical protein